MSDRASDIAKALSGVPTHDGGWLCRCPLPDHGRGRGDRRPSLSIADGEKGLLVFCFAGCAAADVLLELRRSGLIEDGPRSDWPARRPQPRSPAPVEHRPDPEALMLWRGGVPDGDVVKAYLRGRGIHLDPPPTLRQATALQFGRTPIPTMVAAVQAPDREVIAVQQTKLTWQGMKSPLAVPRLTLGAMGAGAVRLAAAEEVLGIAEGVETALSAMELHDVPCWASLGGQRLAKLALPPCVRHVQIFGDNDEAGRLAASMAAGRYSRDGLTVTLRWPPEGYGDWNDVLRARMNEAAA